MVCPGKQHMCPRERGPQLCPPHAGHRVSGPGNPGRKPGERRLSVKGPGRRPLQGLLLVLRPLDSAAGPSKAWARGDHEGDPASYRSGRSETNSPGPTSASEPRRLALPAHPSPVLMLGSPQPLVCFSRRADGQEKAETPTVAREQGVLAWLD